MSVNFVKLGQVATFINGKAFKPSEWAQSGVPIIRIQNLTDDSKEFNYYQGSLEPKYFVKKGDILVSWSASLGVFEWNGENAALNQHIFKVQFDKLDVDKTYFKYIVSQIINEMLRFVHGSTMKHIVKKDFDNTQIPLPSFPEQERIAAIFDLADSVRRKNRQVLEKYNQLAQSVFYEMFGDDEVNPKNWNKSELGAVLYIKNSIKCGPFGSQLKIGEYVNDGIPVYGIDNVAIGKFIQAKNKHVTNKKFADLRAFAIKPKDILMTRTGTVGRACLAPEMTLNAVLGPNLLWIRTNTEVFTPEFLCFLFNHSRSVKSQIGLNSPGATVAVYNTTNLKKLKVVIPPIEIQNHFTRNYKQIEDLKELTQRSLQKSEDLFQSLLQRAFKGEL